MYNLFFGFRENPFNLTPDPSYLFLSRNHREAIDHLLYGINERKGFISIIGGIGTGKTTLCRALLNRLDDDTKSALIFNSFLDDFELLRTLNQEFGVETPVGECTKKPLVDSLNRFLLKTFSMGGNAVLILDEAQNLSRKVLEQIRMLSNLETEREKLIQIVLVGQPELGDVLSSSSLRQLNERITVSYELTSLSRNDIRGYVEHRMKVAGNNGSVQFRDSAISEIYNFSKGNPRRINAICDRSLLVAYTLEKKDISRNIAKKAIKDIKGEKGVGVFFSDHFKQISLSQAILIFLLVIISTCAVWIMMGNIELFGTEKIGVDVPKFSAPVQYEGEKQGKNRPTSQEDKLADIYMDAQRSMSVLFTNFTREAAAQGLSNSDVDWELVSFDIKPEYYAMFNKPFRVRVSADNDIKHFSSLYLVVCSVDNDGVLVEDSSGKRRRIEREVLMKKWDGSVSCIFPLVEIDIDIGTNSPAVLMIQKILGERGYLLDTSGIFDQKTIKELTRFQKDFGLSADGIPSSKTLALLYQMAEKYELYP